MSGAKFDGGKLLFRPLTRGLALPLKLVAAVLTYGAQKYSEDSWQTVPDGARRYEDALDRHLNAWKSGEDYDPESGLLHLGHIACNALFLCWYAMSWASDKNQYFQFKEPPRTADGKSTDTLSYDHVSEYPSGGHARGFDVA